MGRTLFILQGGGPTAVINATLASLLEHAHPHFDRVLGLRHSFEMPTGAPFIDLTPLTTANASVDRARLAATPGSLLGSSRKKVKDDDLDQVLDLIEAERGDSIVGIGGNGTMTALVLLSKAASTRDIELQIIGVPKTVDNDIPGVAYAPGYGSAARFVALAVRDFGFDFRAMSTFDDVTIFETMGRNCGWIAAASRVLSGQNGYPDIVLIPEVPTNEADILDAVAAYHKEKGHVFIIVNEMMTDKTGGLIGEAFQNGPQDSLGRSMYSLSLGTGNYLANRLWKELGLQSRCLRPGNLGRALSFCVSEPDRQLAADCGRHAITALLAHETGKMITVNEDFNLGLAPLEEAMATRYLSAQFLTSDFKAVNTAFETYCRRIIGPVEPVFDAETAASFWI